MFTQLDNATSHALNGVNLIGSSVSVLFLLCAPLAIKFPTIFLALLAITATVIFVCIYSVKCLSFGPVSHFRKEIWKRISKPFAHHNSPSTVVVIGLIVGVMASSFRVLPTAVSRSCLAIKRMAVDWFSRHKWLVSMGMLAVVCGSIRRQQIVKVHRGSARFGPTTPKNSLSSFSRLPLIFGKDVYFECSLKSHYGHKDRPLLKWFSLGIFGRVFYLFISHGIRFFDFNAVISRASETTEAPAILPKLFPRRNCSCGPNWGGGVVSSVPSES